MANKDKTASAWLSANPFIPHCRMSDSSFKTSWKIRTLQPLFPSNMWCKCGSEIDRLGYHFYVCPAKSISTKVRGDVHYALKMAVAETGDYYYRSHQVRSAKEEPHVKDYLEPKPVVQTRHSNQQPTSDESTFLCNPMGPNRRADIAFKPTAQDEMVVLVDVTTVSPLIKRCKMYHPGQLADTAVKAKVDSYSKHFETLSSRTASLWFFAIETNGVFSKEAKKFCQIMAEVAGSPLFIQTIYQRLSVAIQNSISKQIYKATNSYISLEKNITKAPVTLS